MDSFWESVEQFFLSSVLGGIILSAIGSGFFLLILKAFAQANKSIKYFRVLYKEGREKEIEMLASDTNILEMEKFRLQFNWVILIIVAFGVYSNFGSRNIWLEIWMMSFYIAFITYCIIKLRIILLSYARKSLEKINVEKKRLEEEIMQIQKKVHIKSDTNTDR